MSICMYSRCKTTSSTVFCHAQVIHHLVRTQKTTTSETGRLLLTISGFFGCVSQPTEPVSHVAVLPQKSMAPE